MIIGEAIGREPPKAITPYRPTVRPKSGLTWIYFGSVANSKIKIGKTRNLEKRFAEHAASKLGVEIEWTPICAVLGKDADEGVLHRYFCDQLVPGEKELFYKSPDLVAYIRWLRNQFYVYVPELTSSEVERLDAVPSTEWLPHNTERRTGQDPTLLRGLFGDLDFAQRRLTADDFYTNEIIIESARALMGAIDLDPASHPMANSKVRAMRFYTIEENGLAHQWKGRVWLNPPFSNWKPWANKIVDEWESGRISEMCVLSAMRTTTAQYFAPLIKTLDALCILHGRIPFWGGYATDAPDDGHCVMYFGVRPHEFSKQFAHLGTTLFKGEWT